MNFRENFLKILQIIQNFLQKKIFWKFLENGH